MPRLPEVLDRNALPEDKRQIHDYLASTRGEVRLPFSAILNSPEIASRMAHLGTYIRFEGVLPKAVTELATLTVSREHNSRLEWAIHHGFAEKAGVSEAALDAIAYKKPLDGLDDAEAFPIAYARELLTTHKLLDETVTAAQERFGVQGVIELTATVGYYSMMACLIAAIEAVPAATAPQLPEL